MQKGTTNGAATGINGDFEFEVVELPQIILVASFVGMETQEIRYVGKKMKIVLRAAAARLDEVVVTGYQKIDRKLFTGSATYVNGEKAIVEGVNDVGRMLQGKAAGVQVQNVSGTFGASPKIRVRGSSSIYGNSNPL